MRDDDDEIRTDMLSPFPGYGKFPGLCTNFPGYPNPGLV